ncbi:MAG TPA: YtxH domain-containing protein [Aequorivita sp.]|nr:YtxH domain-containing protein [Aequorivita sp.]
MNNKGKGLLALLGIAAGAFAFWKYKNMSPEEKQRLKDKANETGRKIKEKAGEVEDTISEKYEQFKNAAKKEINDITN